MTSAQVVETSVTNNRSFQNYPHLDNHTKIQTTDASRFKPFTMTPYACTMTQTPKITPGTKMSITVLKWTSLELHVEQDLAEMSP